MKNLISSRLFGEILRSEEPGFKNRADYLNWYEKLRNNFDDFLKQPLELWQFIPCKLVDGVWVVLEEPCISCADNCNFDNCLEYQEAKDRVLFEGFEVADKGEFTVWIQKENHSIYFTDRGKININSQNERTVENVIKYEFSLTPTALKQIGYENN